MLKMESNNGNNRKGHPGETILDFVHYCFLPRPSRQRNFFVSGDATPV